MTNRPPLTCGFAAFAPPVIVMRLRRLQIEISLACDALQLRTSEHALAHQLQLRIDVAVHGEALQQRAQRRARVDEDARLGFVHVLHREDDEPAGDTDGPRRCERIPAEAPGAVDLVVDLIE
jgi:hypothetical protein